MSVWKALFCCALRRGRVLFPCLLREHPLPVPARGPLREHGHGPHRSALTIPLLCNSPGPVPRAPAHGRNSVGLPAQPGRVARLSPLAGPQLPCPPAHQHWLWGGPLSIYRPCRGLCSIGSCGRGCLNPPLNRLTKEMVPGAQ